MAVWPNMVVGWVDVDVSRGLGVLPARLFEEVHSGPVLPLQEMHDYCMCPHPETQMHRCVACTKVMAILLLTYPYVLD